MIDLQFEKFNNHFDFMSENLLLNIVITNSFSNFDKEKRMIWSNIILISLLNETLELSYQFNISFLI